MENEDLKNLNPENMPKRRGRPRKIITESNLASLSQEDLKVEAPTQEAIGQVIKHIMDIPKQHAVIQIKTGDQRGVLAQVGEIEGEVVHCYILRPGGEKEHIQTKFGDFHLISQVQKGMVAWQYQKPIKENAPDWHQP